MRMTLVLLAVLLPSVSAAVDRGFVLWAEDSWLQTGDKDYSVYWTLIQSEESPAQRTRVSARRSRAKPSP